MIIDENVVSVLIHLCKETNLDLVENASAALGNIFVGYTGDVSEVITGDEVAVLMDLISSEHTINLLDCDQMSEIQANAANCLASLVTCDASIISTMALE